MTAPGWPNDWRRPGAPTGRPRALKVRALLVALLLLAIDDRPLHLKAATKCVLPAAGALAPTARHNGDASGRKAFLARYRQVRYLFHLVLSVIDPSAEAKNRVLPKAELAAVRKKLTEARPPCGEKGWRPHRPARGLGEVCSADELAGFDGSVGLDATPVPLWSRGPRRAGTTAPVTPTGAGT